MSPDRNAMFEVKFAHPDEFLIELRQDIEDEVVEGMIVRLTHSRRPTAKRLNFFRDHYIDAAYTTTNRNQLVHLSAYCGFEQTGTDGKAMKAPDERTRATLLKVEEIGRKVKASLTQMGIRIRPGGLYIEGSAEPYDGEHEREFITDEVICGSCREPIYFASEHWRHVSDRREARTKKVPCDKCDGSGQIRVATAVVRCTCLFGVREIWEHDAKPREMVSA